MARRRCRARGCGLGIDRAALTPPGNFTVTAIPRRREGYNRLAIGTVSPRPGTLRAHPARQIVAARKSSSRRCANDGDDGGDAEFTVAVES